MSITVSNIGLYLAPKVGNRSDYSLVLSLYASDPVSGCVPDGNLPLARATRSVNDIDHKGWYVFNLDFSIVLPTGHYSIVLHQRSDDENFPVEFDVNFVEWLHDPDIDSNKGVCAFSSDPEFTSDVYGYGYGGHGIGSDILDALIYGYGYGYDNPLDAFDFFNIFGVNGDNTGYGIQVPYGYQFGFENVTFATDDTIQRNFKIYDNFNDIDFLGDNSAKVNIPPAEESTLTIENRQDFLFAIQDGTSIVNDFITLDNYGDRILTADSSVVTSNCVVDKTVEWFPATFALSGNDIAYADITNPSGNTNQFGVYLVSAPFYSGIYVSIDGGSSWEERNTGLTLIDNTIRSFSCVKFGPEGSFIIAFDNTNDTEKGRVFKSTDLGVTWTELTTALDLWGLVVNDAFVVDSNEIWVGTDMGVYRSLDGGATWFAENSGLPAGTNVNQILVDSDILASYGYGYGGGQGLDFFDVFGLTGSFIGYGAGSFETDFENQFEYGYGFEYQFSGGTGRIVAIATDVGAYWLISGSWSRLYPEPGAMPEITNTILFSNNNIYVGKEDGIVRTEIVDEDTESDRIRFRGHSTSEAIEGEFYVHGLLRRKVTKIRSKNTDESNIFVSQSGGIFLSQNDGGNFETITKLLTDRPLKIRDILLNPVNNGIVYAIIETTKFASAGITFLVDCTGSMVANDPDELRIDMALKVMDEVVSAATNTPYFQVIRFGVSEAVLVSNRSIYNALKNAEQDFDFIGAFNLTKGPQGRLIDSGFSSNITLARRALDVSCREPVSGTEHSRSLFFDSLAATSTGLKNFGARWVYQKRVDNQNIYKYQFEDIRSNFYTNLDKSLIIITDGNDTVDGKTLQELIDTTTSDFGDIPADIYIVAVGHNINYENLNTLRKNNNNAKLFLAPYDENIYSTTTSDVADIILEREKFRRRVGTWTKTIDLGEPKITKNAFIKANVPPQTTLSYKVRSTNDRVTFTDFTSDFQANITNSVNLSGRYLDIVIEMTSLQTSFAPEVDEITLTILEPSQSFVYFPLKGIENGDRVSEIELSSLDDISLGNLSKDIIKTEFGIVQSESTNFDFFNSVHRDKRSVLLKREIESLTSTDGFFFQAKNGPWPGDANIRVVDIDEFNQDSNSGTISSEEYFAIPSEGLIVFFDKVDSDRSIGLDLEFISQYRVGLEIKNLDDTSDCFIMHDIAWTYYTESLSQLPRPALPKVDSQLAQTETFGIASPENHETSFSAFTSYLVQYILNTNLTNGVISMTTGQRLDIGTGETSDIRFFDQNTFFIRPQTTESFDQNYLRVLDTQAVDFGVVTITDTIDQSPNLHYQINVQSSTPVNSGESVVFSLGDRSQGSVGISTQLFQENVLFNSDEGILGTFKTNFYIGQKEGTTAPNLANGEFNKIITPSVKIIGATATKLVILAPISATPGGFFDFKVLAVDEIGLIDETFDGTIQFGIEDTTSGTITEGFSYQFSTSDGGVKDFSVFVSTTASGSTRVQAGIVTTEEQAAAGSFDPTIFGTVYTSNTIIYDSSINVFFGDLNTSTIFSDGRQDIEFVADYARNISYLDFVAITDDVDSLETGGNDWTHILAKVEELTSGNIVLIPGFRHRSSDFYGERVVLFNGVEDTTTPQSITSSMKPSNTSSPEAQLTNLVNSLSGRDYITMPVHTPYKTDQLDSIFRGRGLIYNRYRNILSFSASMSDFVTNKEAGVEIYSEHGNTETSDFYQSENFLGFENGVFEDASYVQQALLIGKRFAFTASSGGYHSRPGYYKGDDSPRTQLVTGTVASNKGLTGVAIDNLSRTNIFQAIRNRNTFATTGARIFISFGATTQTQTKNMGGVFTGLSLDGGGKPTDSITFSLRATGDNSTISRIEIVKIQLDTSIATILDSRTSSTPPFNQVDFGFDTGELSFTDDVDEVLTDQELCYYLKITQDDGQFAWSSPIWFNYGREEGIKLTEESDVVTFSQPSISVEQGDIPEVPYSLSKVPPDGISLPDQHVNSFIAGNPLPTERVTYSDKSLYVSEKNISMSGMRLIEDGNINVIYGTQNLKFISTQNDFALEAFTSPLSGNNGEDNGGADENFKYLNDGVDDTISGRDNFIKRHRNSWFGHMWQYVSSGDDFRDSGTFSFEGTVNNNTIHVPDVAEQTKVVMKPCMIQENGVFYLFYSSSIVAYPERPEIGLGGEAGQFPYRDGNGDTDPDRILSEEVAGFNVLNQLTDWGSNLRIHFARGVLPGSRSDFSLNLDAIPPNTINGSPILFSHSPCVIKVSDDETTPFRLYYLGWTGTPLTLTLFVHSFSDIENPASGTTDVCFSFGGGLNTEYDAHNFVPYDPTDGSSDVAWPEDPYYALATNWLSVIQFDDGNYYAFLNFDNTGEKDVNNNDRTSGTAILFSEDGITFFEKNPSDTTQSLTTLPIDFSHPFKASIGGQENWYVLYQNEADQMAYARLNWVSAFQTNKSDL